MGDPQGVVGLLVIPEYFWELSLGIYAAVWGFRTSAATATDAVPVPAAG